MRLCVKSNNDGMPGKGWGMWAYFIGTELQVENTPSTSKGVSFLEGHNENLMSS